MLAVNNLTLRFAGEAIFSGISFMIRPKDRIGLTGKNGAGKTSLMKILIHEIEASEGNISISPDKSIAYLPQHILFQDLGRTLLEELRTAFPEIIKLENTIESINQEISIREDYESEEYRNLIQKLSESTERASFLNIDSINGKIEKTVKGLGFQTTDLNRNTAQFSGGWRMRIELAKLLLQQPDLLMLDEPTNHLDIESIGWLEDFLISYPGAVMLISHDRLFLDNVTKRTIEIDLGKLYDYPAAYSKYEIMRAERISMQLSAKDNQQKKIADAERFVERFRYKATKSKQVQSRIKQLEKTESINIDNTDNSSIHFRFPPAPRSGTIVIDCKKLSKSYGELTVLNGIDLTVERGEKIAFVGKNGEGKTTLVKLILNQITQESGELKTGHNLDIGYYAQNQDEMLDSNKTVFQTLDDEAVGEVRKQVRNILGSFMFTGEDIDKKVSVLSGGERARLSLAKLLLKPRNLLILDEPTNHLDIASKDVLKRALLEYDGTLMIVSHDRYFLNGLVDTVYEFRNKNVKQHLGGINVFLERRKLENMRELNASKQQKKNQKNNLDTSDNKTNYLAKKEQEKIVRKAQRKVEAIESKIEEVERKLAELEIIIANPDKFNQDHFSEYENLQKKQAELLEDWDKAQEKLEALN